MSEAQAKNQRILALLDEIGLELAEARKILKGEAQVLESRKPMLPEPYSEMVTITDQGDSWIIKPRQFLGTSNFAEIAHLVDLMGGKYVSAGKSSHFSIPKQHVLG